MKCLKEIKRVDQKQKNRIRPTGEEIRKAKKFLQNKKMPLNLFKPRLFASASKEINENYNGTLNNLLKVYKATNKVYRRKYYGNNTASTSDNTRNKEV